MLQPYGAIVHEPDADVFAASIGKVNHPFSLYRELVSEPDGRGIPRSERRFRENDRRYKVHWREDSRNSVGISDASKLIPTKENGINTDLTYPYYSRSERSHILSRTRGSYESILENGFGFGTDAVFHPCGVSRNT